MNPHRNRATRIVGILVTVIGASFALANLANAAEEYEPNNSRGTPAGPVAPGSTISATIEVHDDSDWYKFYVAEPGTVVKVTVIRTNAVNEQFRAELVEENGDAVSGAASHVALDPGTASAEISGTVGPGKYFVWVQGNPDTNASGLTYDLAFTQGLSTFEAISSGCTTSQGRLPALTAAVSAKTAAVNAANSALKKTNRSVSKAKEKLSRAKKQTANSRNAKRAKTKAIAKAGKSIRKAKSQAAKKKAALTKARAKEAAAKAALSAAHADADSLCSITE